MDHFKFLLLGNLLLFVIAKQVSFFVTLNIYLIGSLLLNIFLILELLKISKMPRSYSLFFILAIIGLISAYMALGQTSFVIVIMKYLWILTSILLLKHLVTMSKFKIRFVEFQKYAIFVGYFIVVNTLLTILVVDEPYVINEGFKSLLISSDNAKKLGLMVLPFLFLGNKRHILCGFFIIIFLALGSRALMLSMIWSVFFIMVSVLKAHGASKSKHKWLITLLVASFAISAVNISLQSRTVNATNFLSLADRIANWARYSQVMIDYPLGLGPEGGYYFLKENPEYHSVDISYLTKLAVNQKLETGNDTAIEDLIQKRLMISSRFGARSAESIYFDFISSYGLVGLLLASHLVFVLFKDFKYAVSSLNSRFQIIYASFGGLMIYGLFNSFHSSMFLVFLLYVMYFTIRKDQFINSSN